MTEEQKQDAIKKEEARLRKLYKGIAKNRFDLVMPIIRNAAFMKVTLEDLQASINKSGCSEEYKNGENQYGKKAAADLQAYNSLIRNYNTVSERLDKMLPPAQAEKSKLRELADE